MLDGPKGAIWFASIPLFGHLGPLLLQAEELARRGWEVTVATTEEGRAAVERLHGVRYFSLGGPYADPGETEEVVRRLTEEPDFLRGVLSIARMLGEASKHLYAPLVAGLARERPALVVVDFATPSGLDAAEAAGIPLVVNNADLLPVLPAGLFPPAARVPALFSQTSAHEVSGPARVTYPVRRFVEIQGARFLVGRPHNRMRRERGLPPVDFHRRLRGTLILINSAFGLEYPRPLPRRIQMVGPMLRPPEPVPAEFDGWLREGPPVALVSFGTVSAPSAELLRRITEGLEASDFRVLWPLRPASQALLPRRIPPNVRVESWVPQLASLLGHDSVRAFVSHCGTNSVQESLLMGTPVVGIPLFGPQEDMAIRMTDAGVGIRLRKNRFTPEELRQAVRSTIGSEEMRRKIPAIQESIRAAGGVVRAADLLEEEATIGMPASITPGAVRS